MRWVSLADSNSPFYAFLRLIDERTLGEVFCATVLELPAIVVLYAADGDDAAMSTIAVADA